MFCFVFGILPECIGVSCGKDGRSVRTVAELLLAAKDQREGDL